MEVQTMTTSESVEKVRNSPNDGTLDFFCQKGRTPRLVVDDLPKLSNRFCESLSVYQQHMGRPYGSELSKRAKEGAGPLLQARGGCEMRSSLQKNSDYVEHHMAQRRQDV